MLKTLHTDLVFHMHIMTSAHTHTHTLSNKSVYDVYTFMNTESITNKITSVITLIFLNYT